MIEGKKFPKIKGKSLSGKTVELPDDTEGEMTLITIAFKRKAQKGIDSWTQYFEELCEGKKAYELPVIESTLWKIFSGFIDEGMKSGIPKEKHDNVITHYGDVSEFKEKLEIENENSSFIFLLNEDGQIMFKGEGTPDEESKEEFLKKVKKACSSKDD